MNSLASRDPRTAFNTPPAHWRPSSPAAQASTYPAYGAAWSWSYAFTLAEWSEGFTLADWSGHFTIH